MPAKRKQDQDIFSMRLPRDVRAALQKAAGRGQPLSKEITIRLRRSLKGDHENLPTPGIGAVARIIGQVMNTAARAACERKGIPAAQWFTDPWCFDRVEDAAVTCLELLRPAGDGLPPTLPETLDDEIRWLFRTMRNSIGQTVARWTLQDVLAATEGDLAVMREHLGARVVERMAALPAASPFGYAKRVESYAEPTPTSMKQSKGAKK